jgi:hypothetical protein
MEVATKESGVATSCSHVKLYRERLFSSRFDDSRRGRLQDAAEGGTLHVARCPAGSGVPQAVAHFGQFANGSVQLLGLGFQHLPVNARPAIWCEHQRDLIERKSC